MEDIGIITTDEKYLRIPCEKVETKEEGERIALKLFRTLAHDPVGIGLSANQISIPKRVCVVFVKEPLHFINPKYIPVEKDGKFIYLERCLSIPGCVTRTERWKHILISADNLESGSEFDISNLPEDELMDSSDALEIVAIQHEIDHTVGILMTDREYKPLPIEIKKHYNRNDKVIITDGKESLEVKYKNYISKYIDKNWVIAE